MIDLILEVLIMALGLLLVGFSFSLVVVMIGTALNSVKEDKRKKGN